MSDDPIPSSDMQVFNLPMAKIYCDNDFNCRGPIPPFEVADLAASMRDKGLQFAISVQPVADVKGGLPGGYEYRIVAGHRRYTAAKVLGWTSIPATIRVGLNEKTARILNLVENFQRKDLNILQEAEALKHLHEAGVAREAVAREIGMSPGWVQVRFNLLSLPQEIQLEAAAGMISQFHIKQLCSLRNADLQFAAVRKIKEAKLRGEKLGAIAPRKKMTAEIKRARRPEEITDMVEIIGLTAIGYGIHTRTMAWCAGYISSAELFADIKNLDSNFFPPTDF